jgi:uncharacterized membrane protein
MKYPLNIGLRSEIVPLLVIVVSFALGFYFYQHFPEQVVTHWDFAGNPDGYSGKFFGAFGLPFMLLGLYGLFLLLPLIDPKKERYPEFQKVYHLLKAVFLLGLLGVFIVASLANLGYQVPMNHIVPILVGLLMIVIGNFMGKIKNNWFIGIRTPWTLSSENVWNKTHRLGGWLFVLYGILLMMTPLLGYAFGEVVFIAGAVAVVGVTLIYSYVIHKKEQLK